MTHRYKKQILKYEKTVLRPACKECAERAMADSSRMAEEYDVSPHPGGTITEIDKLGLGSEVIRLYSNGMTKQEVADHLGVSKGKIDYYIAKYRNLPLEQKKMVHRTHRSIFDLAERLQETFEMVYTELQEVRGENRELTNRNLQLLLKCIQTGGVFMEKLHAQQEDRRYKAAILQVIEDMAPGTKAKVLKAVSELDLNASIVRRLT